MTILHLINSWLTTT